MLIQLLPEQVTRSWDLLEEAIRRSLPPTVANSEYALTHILESLMLGRMHAWAIIDDSAESLDDYRLLGYVTTTFVIDTNSGEQTLLIYSIFTFRNLTVDVIKKDMETLKKFARHNRCKQITAYTNLDSITNLVKTLYKGVTEYKYISIPIGLEE